MQQDPGISTPTHTTLLPAGAACPPGRGERATPRARRPVPRAPAPPLRAAAPSSCLPALPFSLTRRRPHRGPRAPLPPASAPPLGRGAALELTAALELAHGLRAAHRSSRRATVTPHGPPNSNTAPPGRAGCGPQRSSPAARLGVAGAAGRRSRTNGSGYTHSLRCAPLRCVGTGWGGCNSTTQRQVLGSMQLHNATAKGFGGHATPPTQRPRRAPLNRTGPSRPSRGSARNLG
jgi:hypothetical protein